MNSQEKWGIFFIIAGLIIVAIFAQMSLIGSLVYALPLLILGLVLIIFKNRESKIEQP
jgi:membrane-bound ClpP family serine protease